MASLFYIHYLQDIYIIYKSYTLTGNIYINRKYTRKTRNKYINRSIHIFTQVYI